MRKINPYTEFIRERVMQGRGVTEIHRELVNKYPNNPPAYITVKKWASFYKAAREGREEDPGIFEISKINKKFREFIKNNMDMGRTPREIYERLRKKYPKNAPCCATVVKWCYRVQYAREGQLERQREQAILENLTGSGEVGGLVASLDSNSTSTQASATEAATAATSVAAVASQRSAEVGDDQIELQSDSYLSIAPNHGFHLNLVPERIYDSFVVDGERFFAIKWKNWTKTDLGRIFYDFFCEM